MTPELNEGIQEEVADITAVPLAQMEILGDDNKSNNDHLLAEIYFLTSLLQILKQYFVFMEPMERANGKYI